ncbi:hypothetical protein HPB48_016138 [Haemaphysalis longicornis]|uniref:Alpha-1,3-mannosyl-glycoprotein 2-beta-N-acetylglucosaminyltransferase n=1 Tax=Haemaphysalis longicornis TaxID=44386 RepID=A0A9J6FN41_HAELO|nr:hypothetical protein HPB48_016138 [Haemaphysalis longicornis]
MNRLRALILAGALVWAFVTVLIFLQISQNRLQEHVRSQVNALDQDVRSQLSSNEEVLDRLRWWKKQIEDSRRGKEVIATLVLACDRVSVNRTLDQVIKYRPSPERFPVIISQDGYHDETSALLRQYEQEHGFLFIQQPDQTVLTKGMKAEFNIEGYYRIARHYKWALGQVFDRLQHTALVLHFRLQRQRQALADLPVTGHASPTTDFFSGLGWLLTRELWHEIGHRWPKSFWDDWMRMAEQRRGRACIRPEVSRTRTFGKSGVSWGQFFDAYLKDVHLNDVFVRFSSMDLSYLHQRPYDRAFLATVRESRLYSLDDLKGGRLTQSPARISYSNETVFENIADFLGIMRDFKEGVPRTAYKGVVSTYYKGIRLFLVPEPWAFLPRVDTTEDKSIERGAIR